METAVRGEHVDHFAQVVLRHTEREYPSKLDHVINGPEQVLTPRELHPMFYGSFDWHSSVHGHWLLVRALRLNPRLLEEMPRIGELFDVRFTESNVAAEVAYLRQKGRETFERMYGWSWLLKLAAELMVTEREWKAAGRMRGADRIGGWSRALGPLAEAFERRYVDFLPKATYPIRVGTHTNSAFGLVFALDYAATADRPELAELLRGKARAWYGRDRNCPAWEPDGSDFFSPALMEVECMRRVLEPGAFAEWLDGFLPGLAVGKPGALFVPATVSDRTDGYITHLDGLNLSRAWCWRSLAGALREEDPRRALALDAHRRHLKAAIDHVKGDYAGEHWLATFAVLALTE